MTRSLPISLLLFCSLALSGQNTGTAGTAKDDTGKIPESKKYQIMSPQTADFVRYDNAGITETSGRIDLSIPVISFNDPDFDFPITLSYNSSGFKPAETDNYVGRNWMLDFGGMIYREIKGAPDETADLKEYGVRGFLHTIRNNKYNDSRIKSEAWKDPYSALGYSAQVFEPVMKDTYYDEFSSDIYHFRIGSHSGKFMINFDGTTNVISYDGGHYEVDISKFFPLSYSSEGFSCEIMIAADDGYRYYFGGDYRTLEYQAHSWTDSDLGNTDISNPPAKGAITGFHLSKIIAPNGRELRIRYRGNLPSEYVDSPYKLLDNNIGSKARKYCQEFIIQSSPFRNTSIDAMSLAGNPLMAHVDNPAGVNTHYGNSYSMCKVVMPESITTDEKEIVFHYSSRKHTTLENDTNLFINGKYCGSVLDSVELRRTDVPGNRAEVTKFVYTYTSGNYPRMFLQSVISTKSGIFTFSYNHINSLPFPQTTNIDHWGYWRGMTSNKKSSDEKNSELIPEISNTSVGTLDSPPDYFYTSSNREATRDSYDWGMLISVTYPTGGSSVFSYEPNDYSYKLCYNSDWFPHIAHLDSPALAGGIRIKCISQHSSLPANESNLIRRVWYSYKETPGRTKSSGTLMYEPRYIHQVKLWTRYYGYEYILTENSSGFNSKDYSKDHILYSVVTKEEELTRDYKPDATSMFNISPNSPDSEPVFMKVSVSGANQIWSFKCRAVNGGSGAAYILDNARGTKIKKYSFSAPYQDSIHFCPADSLEPGDYTIALKKTGNVVLSFNERFPGSGRNLISGRKTVSAYTDYFSNPDIYYDSHSYWNERFSKTSLMPCPEVDSLYLKRFTLEPEDYSHERGKLKSQRIYSDADTLQYSIDYSYRRIDSGLYNLYSYIALPVSGAPLYQYFHINRVPFTLYLPNSRTVREYDGDMVKEQQTSYTYQHSGYLCAESVRNNDGTSDITYFRRIDDETDKWYDEIRSIRNVRSYPTETVKIHSGPDAVPMSTSMSCFYGTSPSQTNPDIVLEAQVGKIDGIVSASISFDHFDCYSNAIQVTRDSISSTIYLWSYLGKHIIAKIENASYEEVSAALGAVPESVSVLQEPDFTMINRLRTMLPKAHIWTYSYIPLIGMSSETDPSGTTTFYSYDSAGRLSEIYMIADGRKEILKAYDYHLVNAL